MKGQLSFSALLAIILLTVTVFWGSVLSFIPVSWPDDSAFYLPGVDLVQWPPVYHMHAQAPFVPSYDVANFNTMPALPLLLGIGSRLGIHTSHAIRIFGMMAFGSYVILLVLWMLRRGLTMRWIWLLALGALFSPAIRWGAMVVRTEIWQGLFWLLILMELDHFFKRPSGWRLPFFLALAAYFHFEAVVWVIPVSIALITTPNRIKAGTEKLLDVGWRTTVLLSPWILYVLLNWSVFWIQMHTQFGRLEATHPYLQSAYGIFHNLFLSLGSPAGYPKFFNLGKVLTWLAFVGSFGALAGSLKLKDRRERGVVLAALAGVVATSYLWATKPETWFTILIHLTAWPVLVIALGRTVRPWIRGAAFAAISFLVILEAGVSVQQWREIHRVFSWSEYSDWVDCIDRGIGSRTHIWQPHWPDVLVELSGRNPGRDYTRSVDFQNIDPLLRSHAQKSEAIIHSLFFMPDDPKAQQAYSGSLRESDRYLLTDYPWIPFKEYSALRMGAGWSIQVCQRGPFWAALSLRDHIGAGATK